MSYFLAFLTLCHCVEEETPSSSALLSPELICHAGGALNRQEPYRHSTNSLEAITVNYERGFRFFELDFSWTSDQRLVIIHDWDNAVRRMFSLEPQQLSYEEFTTLPYSFDTTQLTLTKLGQWLEERKDAYLVTDIKEENLAGLKLLSDTMPQLMRQIVPQIYSFEEYQPVKDMGYENIILTLYRMGGKDEDIVDFAKTNPLFSVTMPHQRGLGELPQKLKEHSIQVYAHTINDVSQLRELQNNSVQGIYTDFIFPDTLPPVADTSNQH